MYILLILYFDAPPPAQGSEGTKTEPSFAGYVECILVPLSSSLPYEFTEPLI